MCIEEQGLCSDKQVHWHEHGASLAHLHIQKYVSRGEGKRAQVGVGEVSSPLEFEKFKYAHCVCFLV